MLLSRSITRHLVLASVALFVACCTPATTFAQDEAAGQAGDNKPIVPSTPFPSLMALDDGDSVWTLKIVNSTLKVNGDVAVNSTNKGALWMSGGILDTQNGQVNLVGGVSRLGKNTIRPAEVRGANVTEDPLPEFRIPSPGKVISREKVFLDTNQEDQLLPPGIYNGGIFASGKGNIELQPGVFVIANGDFSVIGPTVVGRGVTIVMAGDKPGALSFSLGARFNASAPTSGTLKDLLVISRSEGTFAKGVSFASAQGSMQGIIYTPKAPFSVQSQSRVKASKIIAASVDVTASNLDVTGTGTAAANAPAGNAAGADGEEPAAQN